MSAAALCRSPGAGRVGEQLVIRTEPEGQILTWRPGSSANRADYFVILLWPTADGLNQHGTKMSREHCICVDRSRSGQIPV